MEGGTHGIKVKKTHKFASEQEHYNAKKSSDFEVKDCITPNFITRFRGERFSTTG